MTTAPRPPILPATHLRFPCRWELPDAAVTPEAHYLGRREFLRRFGSGLAGAALLPAAFGRAATAGFPDALNPAYGLPGVKLTPLDAVISYNNFYEWGLSKEQPKTLANAGWKTEPWTLEIGGLCAEPAKFEVNELIKARRRHRAAQPPAPRRGSLEHGHALGRLPAARFGACPGGEAPLAGRANPPGTLV